MTTPTADVFGSQKPDVGSPVFSGAFAITPGVALPLPTRALWVGGAGNVGITDTFGNTVTLNGVAAGTYIPVRVTAVSSTASTTATNIVGLFR